MPIPKQTKAALDAIDRNWTVGPEGRANTSERYLALSARVGEILRNSAHDLIAGRTDGVGALIMAQLAHKEGLGPLPEAPVTMWRCIDTEGLPQPSGPAVPLFQLGKHYPGKWDERHAAGWLEVEVEPDCWMAVERCRFEPAPPSAHPDWPDIDAQLGRYGYQIDPFWNEDYSRTYSRRAGPKGLYVTIECSGSKPAPHVLVIEVFESDEPKEPSAPNESASWEGHVRVEFRSSASLLRFLEHRFIETEVRAIKGCDGAGPIAVTG